MADTDRFNTIRQEMIQLLRAQLELLADISNLSDAQLAECYRRHDRVRVLRDRLFRAGGRKPEERITLNEHAPTSISADPQPSIAAL